MVINLGHGGRTFTEQGTRVSHEVSIHQILCKSPKPGQWCPRIHHQSNMPAPAVYIVFAVVGAFATCLVLKEVRSAIPLVPPLAANCAPQPMCTSLSSIPTSARGESGGGRAALPSSGSIALFLLRLSAGHPIVPRPPVKFLRLSSSTP